MGVQVVYRRSIAVLKKDGSGVPSGTPLKGPSNILGGGGGGGFIQFTSPCN